MIDPIVNVVAPTLSSGLSAGTGTLGTGETESGAGFGDVLGVMLAASGMAGPPDAADVTLSTPSLEGAIDDPGWVQSGHQGLNLTGQTAPTEGKKLGITERGGAGAGARAGTGTGAAHASVQGQAHAAANSAVAQAVAAELPAAGWVQSGQDVGQTAPTEGKKLGITERGGAGAGAGAGTGAGAAHASVQGQAHAAANSAVAQAVAAEFPAAGWVQSGHQRLNLLGQTAPVEGAGLGTSVDQSAGVGAEVGKMLDGAVQVEPTETGWVQSGQDVGQTAPVEGAGLGTSADQSAGVGAKVGKMLDGAVQVEPTEAGWVQSGQDVGQTAPIPGVGAGAPAAHDGAAPSPSPALVTSTALGRVMEAIEAADRRPPPNTMAVELPGETGAERLRLIITVRNGAVHITGGGPGQGQDQGGSQAQDGLPQEWRQPLADALAERGMTLSGFSANGQQQRGTRETPVPGAKISANSVAGQRAANRVHDGALRL